MEKFGRNLIKTRIRIIKIELILSSRFLLICFKNAIIELIPLVPDGIRLIFNCSHYRKESDNGRRDGVNLISFCDREYNKMTRGEYRVGFGGVALR